MKTYLYCSTSLTFLKPDKEVKNMTKNTENKENTNFRSLTFKLINSEAENQQLRKDNQLLSDELAYFKSRCEDLEEEVDHLQNKNKELKKQYDDFYEKEYLKRIEECNDLWGQLFDIKHMSVWEFANKYCNEKQLEDAGHAFARSLLGHRMTDDELAIEAAENAYVPYNGDDF